MPRVLTNQFLLNLNSYDKYLGYLKTHEFSQASVYSLLQAASEISSRGDRRDRGINLIVQRR